MDNAKVIAEELKAALVGDMDRLAEKMAAAMNAARAGHIIEPLPIVYTKITDFLGGSIAGKYAAGASGAEPLAQRSGASDPPRLSTPVYTSAGVQSFNAWCGRSSL